MLRQLLKQFPADSYAVLTDRLSSYAGLSSNDWLPAPHYFLGTEHPYSPNEASAAAAASSTAGERAGRGLLAQASRALIELDDVTAKLRELTRQAIRTIDSEKPEIILAPSSDPIFIVAAARASRVSGTLLYVHLFDLFAGNRYSPPRRILARRTQRHILTSARRVFVPNEAMAGHYRDRLGISTVVIPNGTLIPTRPSERDVADPPTILYTGAVYWAQRDALQHLSAAMKLLPGVRLEARTSASSRELARAHLKVEHTAAGFSTQEAALEAQRSADILFLPLAFHTSAQDVIRTAFPAKVAEYLVSGTPILVHAPPDAFISQYARKSHWGYVVDTPDPNALAAAIRRLLDDSQLRRALVTSAYDEARRAHDFRKIGPEYMRYFS